MQDQSPRANLPRDRTCYVWTRLGEGDRERAQRQKEILKRTAAARGISVDRLAYSLLMAGGLRQLEKRSAVSDAGAAVAAAKAAVD